ncbi:MAG: hypothetical protein JNJ61_29895, partial [Anaerolineae bacterium]|nr:hypothetical protein [Anaerolineae bacterium]
MKLKFRVIGLLAILILSFNILITNSQDTQPTTVTIAGSFQKQLGCSEDWQPACETTQLTYDIEDDVWQATLELPAGEYEYKAALNGAWDENYGASAAAGGDNIKLSISEAQSVKFYYDHKTHWVTDNVNSVIAVAIGDFQSELGCNEDGKADCLRSWLQDEDANGVYSFATTTIPVGEYTAKVALNESTEETYGARGELNGENLTFSVDTEGFRTTFGFSPSRKLFNIRVTDPNAVVEPTVRPTPAAEIVTGLTVTVPGSYNSEIGCSEDLGADGDWAPDCQLTQMNDDDGDGIYTFITAAIPQGSYEAKVAIDYTWGENYGADGARDGANIAFEVPVDYAQVTFIFDSASKLLTITLDESIIGSPAGPGGAQPIVLPPQDVVQPETVTIPGTLQSVLGCSGDWQPDCDKTFLTLDAADNIWKGSFALPAGSYEYKVAINKTWDENYGGNADLGGPNVQLVLSEDTVVNFYYDHATHWVADSVGDVIATAP